MSHSCGTGSQGGMDDEVTTDVLYDVIPDPQASMVDLSKLRGVAEPRNFDHTHHITNKDSPPTTDLENLAELVPDVRKSSSPAMPMNHQHHHHHHLSDSALRNDNMARSFLSNTINNNNIGGSMEMHESFHETNQPQQQHRYKANTLSNNHRMNDDDDHGGNDSPSEIDAYSDSALEARPTLMKSAEFMSAQSMSTATQTHEVLMPMYLPTFKPATGCTNASDFIVRCFVARLRSGITVVKHGRSRWAKSRLRILHVHNDGRSLSWKPAEGEPSSSKRPPKLDLSTCTEVRHAWSPDPQNPMYTGTSILRLKCEAANAHKSFALIFPTRTVDITAVTADQCKVLMEGFSALCFRLQVANLAKSKHSRPMPEEDGVSTTASATLTNNSTPRGATAGRTS